MIFKSVPDLCFMGLFAVLQAGVLANGRMDRCTEVLLFTIP